MIRDVAGRVPLIREKVERLGEAFADYVVLIVENDSKDGTRRLLLEWAARNPKVKVLGCHSVGGGRGDGGEVVPAESCSVPSAPKTDGHSVDRPRIEKMVKLRNVYLDEIKRKYSSWNFAAMWDLDPI